MSRGDIILVPFPFTDLSGHKVRPALVLHDERRSEDCIIVFISSLKQKRAGVFDLPVKSSPLNGLKVDSVVKINKIAALQKRIALGKLGALEKSSIATVEKKLRSLFQI